MENTFEGGALGVVSQVGILCLAFPYLITLTLPPYLYILMLTLKKMHGLYLSDTWYIYEIRAFFHMALVDHSSKCFFNNSQAWSDVCGHVLFIVQLTVQPDLSLLSLIVFCVSTHIEIWWLKHTWRSSSGRVITLPSLLKLSHLHMLFLIRFISIWSVREREKRSP